MRKFMTLLFSLLAVTAGAQQLTEKDPSREDTFIMVQQMPQYPGGQDSLFSYIRRNLVYPEKAKEKGIEGKVFVGFVVDQTGKVKDAVIKRSVDPMLDAEALRVVKQMPNWQPGYQEGKAVNVSYVLPLNFRLDF